MLQAQTKIRLLENKLEGGYHALNEEGALIRAIRYPPTLLSDLHRIRHDEPLEKKEMSPRKGAGGGLVGGGGRRQVQGGRAEAGAAAV